MVGKEETPLALNGRRRTSDLVSEWCLKTSDPEARDHATKINLEQFRAQSQTKQLLDLTSRLLLTLTLLSCSKRD